MTHWVDDNMGDFYLDQWARGDEMGDIADWHVDMMTSGKMPVGVIDIGRSNGRPVKRNSAACIRHGYWYVNGEQVRKATLAEEVRYGVTGRGEAVFTDEPVALKKLKQYNSKESVNMEKVMVNGQLQTYVAVVNFINGHNTYKDYDFLCNIPLAENDLVVVDSANGFGLARVCGIKTASRAATNWVVDRVDLEAHNARIYAETRRKELEKEMESRMRKLDKLAKYRLMAESDPEMKRMLDEMEALENGTISALPSSEGSDNE